MEDRKILTIQDISCVGQCSLTVALPILSACGIETAILPSAVLSTHTGGFKGFTFRDLTEDMPSIEAHWAKEGIKFNAFYTGYLGSSKQIDYVKRIIKSSAAAGSFKVIDPAMADNGSLYYGFDKVFVGEMRTLCKEADYLLPNITEACFLCDAEYKETYDEAYVKELLKKLSEISSGTIVLTGVSYKSETTGVVVSKNGDYQYYEHRKIAKGCHGTGDVYASAFTGALFSGKTAFEAAKIAADYVVLCIENTQRYDNHWYGVKFEEKLGDLIRMIKG